MGVGGGGRDQNMHHVLFTRHFKDMETVKQSSIYKSE